jgi:hypothetical protein
LVAFKQALEYSVQFLSAKADSPASSALYEEAITCYNEKVLILCAAGLRALLEGICQDKRIKGILSDSAKAEKLLRQIIG